MSSIPSTWLHSDKCVCSSI